MITNLHYGPQIQLQMRRTVMFWPQHIAEAPNRTLCKATICVFRRMIHQYSHDGSRGVGYPEVWGGSGITGRPPPGETLAK